LEAIVAWKRRSEVLAKGGNDEEPLLT